MLGWLKQKLGVSVPARPWLPDEPAPGAPPRIAARAGPVFAVDDVSEPPTPLSFHPDRLATAIGGPPLVTSATLESVVACADVPGLWTSVELAYKTHRPLVWSPDAVWLTLANGFARHVNANAEALRGRFVRHDGKKVLRVGTADLETAAAFERAFDMFGAALAEELGPGVVRLLSCDFSTTTATARAASRVVLMDAFQPFFDYELRCICGIPQVRLLGTADDWREIARRLDVLAEYDLEWWVAPLRDVARAWVASAEGKADRDFWQCIWAPQEIYGGEKVHGWITRLFPYAGHDGARHTFAPYTPADAADEEDGPSGGSSFRFDALTPARTRWLSRGTSAMRGGLSRVPIRLVEAGVEGGRVLVAVAGVFGPAIDADGYVVPLEGWAVREDPREALFERMAARHHAEPARAPLVPWRLQADPVPALLLELYAHFHTVRFFGGRVRLLPADELRQVRVEGPDGSAHGVAFAQLDDGSTLAYVSRWEPQTQSDVEDVAWIASDGVDARPVARSLLEVLQRLTDEPTSFV